MITSDGTIEANTAGQTGVSANPTVAGAAKAATKGKRTDAVKVPGQRKTPSAALAKDKPATASGSGHSKTDLVLKKLRLAKGAAIEQLMEVTGWQAHSVRGFLSAVVRKKMGLALLSEVGKDGARRYRVTDAAVRPGDR